MKHVFRTLGLHVALLALIAMTPLAANAQTTKLTLMHLNDVYEISAKRGKGGLAQAMTLIERERAAAKNNLLTLGGDLLSPSVMSSLTKGAQMIDVMNALRVDASVPGNHEFDFGADIYKQRVAESNFPWVSTNVLGPDGKPFAGAKDMIIREFDGLKVGIFGVLTAETTHLSSPGADVNFSDVHTTAKQATKALKAAGADFVIALTHLDLDDDRKLARSIRGINVILGGHDHDPIAIFEGKKLILKAGYDAHYLAVADLVITKKEKRGKMRVSMLPQFRFISTAGVEPHPAVNKIVAAHEAKLDEQLGAVVGTTETALDSQRSSVRTKETTMGNLIADAVRAAVGADVGLANGGGIRGDRTYDAGTKLTRKDVLSELPFGNVTVLMELSGADLLAALENGVSRFEDKAGRFPQVSGMSFSFSPAKPAGSRVSDAMVGGKPLDTSATYTVATNDYIAGGGDGYKVLKKGRLLVDASGGTLMASQVMNHIAKTGSVAPKVEGRIVEK